MTSLITLSAQMQNEHMAADPDSIYDVLDTVDSAAPHSKMSELGKPREEDGVGKRSTSPPGREPREDWRGGEWSRNLVSGEPQQKPISRSRSRSRSPAERRPRASSRDRQFRYEKEGCNTTSDQPHLQRARLFVGNIDPNRVHRRDLIRIFSQYGDVVGVSVHKGYAFMQMDREKSANKAISALDNRMLMGSRVHVEFSQAALKAGAKFERLPVRESPPPPPPTLRDRSSDTLAIFQMERDTLRDREERLTRILRMERELAYLRTRDEYYDSVVRRPQYDLPQDRGIADSYHRLSPPSAPREYSSVIRDYSLPRPDERSLYARPNDRSAFERPPSPGVLREPISYPMPASGRPSAAAISSLERRDVQYGGAYSQRPVLSSPAVGYGSSAGSSNLHPSKPGALPSGAPPPGWPSTMYDKANANRAPFTNATPWI